MTMHGNTLSSANTIKRPVCVRVFAFAVAEDVQLSTRSWNAVSDRNVNVRYRRELPIDP